MREESWFVQKFSLSPCFSLRISRLPGSTSSEYLLASGFPALLSGLLTGSSPVASIFKCIGLVCPANLPWPNLVFVKSGQALGPGQAWPVLFHFLVCQFGMTSHHSLVCMAPATASAVNLAGQVASKGNFVFLAFEMSFVITNFISGYEQSLSPPHWGAQLQVKLLFYPRRCSKTTSLLRSLGFRQIW